MRVGIIPQQSGGSYKFTIYLLASLGLLIATLPVIIIALMSFSAAETTSFPPQAYSLRWYIKMFELFQPNGENSDASLQIALLTSLKVAALVMLIASVVCVPLAYVLVRSGGRLKNGMELLFTLPLVFPLVILGIAFLLIAESLDLELGIWRLVIPHVALVLPFVLRNCVGAMSSIDIELEQAAISLGASPLRAGVDIVVPLMKPGIIAGLVFALIISFNEFTITYFMYTVDVTTLPIWMYSRTVSSLDPSTLAISFVIVLIDLALILLIDKLLAGRNSLL
ncbi:ABC transporter permease [Alginatibacterium sediminis]|uniref:ABC transporter permease n=1 Tax=Alginatibacterium sediminis TaxID=2164068 RepID=A0A420E7A4_9ALTE|nr:ABC transporter permease [Alginatibacterium sediminis]RKF14354.1 ABC transporter permease [Alginatibacterium sediminis]